MPTDSTGNFTPLPSYRVVSGDTVLPVQYVPVVEDIANGLTNRLMKDGRTVWAGDMKAGGFKVTGMAPGELSTDSATVGQVGRKASFKTVAELLADTTLSYTTGPARVSEGDIIEAQGFRYEVAAGDAVTFDKETAGGVRLVLLSKPVDVLPQDLTGAEQEQARANIGIPDLSIKTIGIAEDSVGRLKISSVDHSGAHILTANGQQFVTFVDDELNFKVAQRAISSTLWSVYDTGGNITAEDSHNAPAIGADPGGYLHIIYDAHAGPFKYRKSTNPYDASAWGGESGTLTGVNESSFTYPYFFNLADGTLMLMYRQGTSSNGKLVLNQYDETAGSWSQVGVLWDYGTGFSYLGAPVVDGSGVIHLAWTVWDSSVSARRDIFYMKSADGGSSWTHADGTPVATPITADGQAELVDNPSVPIGTPAYPANVPVTVDPQGRPVLTYKKQVVNGDWHIFCAYFDDGWTVQQVTADHEPYLPAGLSDVDPLTWGNIWNVCTTQETVCILMQNRPYGTEPVMLEAMADDYTEWRRIVLSEQPLGSCTPQIDMARASEGIINTLATTAYEESSIMSALAPASPLSMIEMPAPERQHISQIRPISEYAQYAVGIKPIVSSEGSADSGGESVSLTSTSYVFLSSYRYPKIHIPRWLINGDVELFVSWRIRTSSPSDGSRFSIRVGSGDGLWLSGAEQHNGVGRTTKVGRWIKIPRSIYMGSIEGGSLFLQAKIDNGTTTTPILYRDFMMTLGVRPKWY